MATYFPDLFTGVGFHCVMIDDESFGDMLLQNGKTLIKALEFLRKLPF